MPGGKVNTRMRQAAQRHLAHTAAGLAAAWGEASEEDGVFVFSPAPPFCSLRLELLYRPKFLGGILAMQCVAIIETPSASSAPQFPHGPLTLQYRGLLMKGAAYFSTGNRAHAAGLLADRLHSDAALISQLGVLDIEHLSIAPVSAQGLQVTLRPVGGGYVWSLLPPVKYAVPLPADQATAMVDALTGIGRHINALAYSARHSAT